MFDSLISDKHIKTNMKLALYIASQNDICFSRKIGTVITDINSVILSVGINGPPRKTPHCDSEDYIAEILWDKLSDDNKSQLTAIAKERNSTSDKEFDNLACSIATFAPISRTFSSTAHAVGRLLDGCKMCPRKMLGSKSGENSDWCSCAHSEANSITNAKCSLEGGFLFCSCENLSCTYCTGLIINAGIKEVHFVAGPEYHAGCVKLYMRAGIKVYTYTLDWINEAHERKEALPNFR